MRRSKWFLLLLLSLRLNAAGSGTVVFLSDFDQKDDAVAICKGVMHSLLPSITIFDLCHEVTPYSIVEGARFLAGASAYYPPKTVFLGVVDPGVGSRRKAMAAHSKKDQYFVLPDNGLITLVLERDGLIEAREISNSGWILKEQVSSTFHGRDIFSPVAARLAKGDPITEVGPVIAEPVRIKINVPAKTADGLEGEIQGTDGPYGNLISNIRLSDLEKIGVQMNDEVGLKLKGKKLSFPLKKTFSDVGVGKPLFYLDSKGFLALAINQGNFSKTYKVGTAERILISAKKK